MTAEAEEEEGVKGKRSCLPIVVGVLAALVVGSAGCGSDSGVADSGNGSIGACSRTGGGSGDLIAFSIGLERDIFAMNANGGEVRRLTSSDKLEYGGDWSPDGRRLAFVRRQKTQGKYIGTIFVMNADGSGERQLTSNHDYGSPEWSPDGQRIVLTGTRDGDSEIFVMDADGGNVTQLTSGGDDRQPTWSADCRRIAFVRSGIVGLSGSLGEIFVMDADGGNVTQLTSGSVRSEDPKWSPDGQRIVFESMRDRPIPTEIFVMDADGGNVRQLTNNRVLDLSPVWSPDGKQIAFSRDRSGNGDWLIYVMDADGSNVKSTGQAGSPMSWGG